MSGMKFLKFCAMLCLPQMLGAQVALHGLFTPVVLNADTSIIYVRDFLPDLDYSEIILPEGLVNHRPGSDTLVLTGKLVGKMSTLDLTTSRGTESLLLINANLKDVSIRIPENLIEGSEVRIFGSFNNWNRDVAPSKPEKGFYLKTLQLPPGRYEYKLLVDGEERTDPSNSETVSNGMGGFNNVLRVADEQPPFPENFELRRRPNSDIEISIADGANQYLAFWNNRLIPVNCNQVESGLCQLRIPAEARTLKRSYIRIYSYAGQHRGKDMLVPLDSGKVVKSSSQLDRTDWHQARMYFLMVDRFNNANKENDLPTPDPAIQPQANYLGGDLEGVDHKVRDNFFDSLGVNTIWLSPITQGPLDAWGYWDKGEVKSKFSAYHGYWPTSNIRVDFRFGTAEDLHRILNDAHRRDQNVILDYVANHVHLNHPIYQNHPEWATSLYLEDGTKNTEKWDEQRLTTWFDDHLPTLDLRQMKVVDPLVDSALFWLKEYSFDGFRHDATKHIDELYWRTLSYRIKKYTARPIYQIGETYGSPQLINSYISTGMLDAQFDFNLYDASVAAFASQNGNLKTLVEKLNEGLQTYGYHHLMGNITGNQDRARFISLCSGEVKFDEDAKLAGWDREIGKPKFQAYQRLALLHAFNNAVPGIPCIYYGDEFGLPGAGDPDNRRMMKFEDYDEDEAQLLSKVKKLYHLRGKSLPLIYGSTEAVSLNEYVILIKRRYFQDEVWILLNNSDHPQHVDIEENLEVMLSSEDLALLPGTVAKQKLRLEARSYIYLTDQIAGK
jgi:cyclomaltodextrinase